MADNRPSAAMRGYDRQWRKLRAHLLRHPVKCSERRCFEQATELDHVVPIRIAPERRLDTSNLRPLCKSCHSKKTRADNNAKPIGNRADGMPSDPRHPWNRSDNP